VSRAVVVHYAPAEAGVIAERIRREGFEADVCPARGAPCVSAIRENPPDVIVIDLIRMPSYGRWIAALLRQQRSTRMIPLVFVEGDPEKARLVRKLLPDAVFTSLDRIGASLEKAIRTPVCNPMPADPTRVPAAGKLRIREGSKVALLHEPDDFRASLEPLPKRVRFQTAVAGADVVLLFVKSAAQLARELPSAVKQAEPKAAVWVIWPKKTSGVKTDITLPVIFGIFASLGLAMQKVCAVDKTWSGLAMGKSRAAHAR
jgi:CheY-like chemotaxis protein